MRYLVLLAPFIAAFIALTMRTRTQALVVLFIYLSVEGMLKHMLQRKIGASGAKSIGELVGAVRDFHGELHQLRIQHAF